MTEVLIMPTGPIRIQRPALGPGEEIRIGCAVAQRLTYALCGKGIPYDELSKIVYGELLAISRELEPGDWLELPDGSSWTKDGRP